jgi:hypothetical protein
MNILLVSINICSDLQVVRCINTEGRKPAVIYICPVEGEWALFKAEEGRSLRERPSGPSLAKGWVS